MVKTKKYQYKCRTLAKMTNMRNEKNQKEFWKMLKNISPNKSESGGITPGTFARHFQSILNTSIPIIDIPLDRECGPLDYNITVEEVKKASLTLKPGKATGIDNISNEMILSLFTNYPDIILKLFNTIMQSNEIKPEWVLGAIVPIHKKGSKTDPSNYLNYSHIYSPSLKDSPPSTGVPVLGACNGSSASTQKLKCIVLSSFGFIESITLSITPDIPYRSTACIENVKIPCSLVIMPSPGSVSLKPTYANSCGLRHGLAHSYPGIPIESGSPLKTNERHIPCRFPL